MNKNELIRQLENILKELKETDHDVKSFSIKTEANFSTIHTSLFITQTKVH